MFGEKWRPRKLTRNVQTHNIHLNKRDDIRQAKTPRLKLIKQTKTNFNLKLKRPFYIYILQGIKYQLNNKAQEIIIKRIPWVQTKNKEI